MPTGRIDVKSKGADERGLVELVVDVLAAWPSDARGRGTEWWDVRLR